jgi:transposase-like protein
MNLGICPYCELDGLVVTVKVTPRGFEVSGKCATCGYTCDSEYASGEMSSDLLCEVSLPVEASTRD